MFYVLGDIHGITDDLRTRLMQCVHASGLMPSDNDCYFLCGDVGIAYGGSSPKRSLMKLMGSTPGTFLVMRGNHDDRYTESLRKKEYVGLYRNDWCGIEAWSSEHYPNVRFLNDSGGIFVRNDKKCLVMPGAYSVDRDYRLAIGAAWCPREQLNYGELDRLVMLSEQNDIDYVFSHTAPFSWIHGPVKPFLFAGLDESNIEYGMERAFDVVLDNVKNSVKGWYFGHYHGDLMFKDKNTGVNGYLVYTRSRLIPELA